MTTKETRTNKGTAAKGTAAPKAGKVNKVDKVGTNALRIPWPSDPYGLLSALKRGGVAAAKRVNGDREKLAKLLETLELIEAHAKARFKKDVAARKAARANAVAARARVAERRARQAEAVAREYEAAAARVRKEAGVKPKTKPNAAE